MKIYLAGCSYTPWKALNIYNFNRLDSYLDVRKNDDFDHTKFQNFILDSGVFSFLNGKDISKIDWDEYVDNYAKFVRERKIRNYVEVDIDRFYGLDVVEKLRRNLERKVGWKSMPVWHMNRGYDKWLEIARDYEYICFGAFLTDHLNEKHYPLVAKFIYDAKQLNCKVHGLGFTSMPWLKRLHFYSVDSSSWTANVRFGAVCYFNGKAITMVKRPENKKVIDMRGLAYHSFKEWVKFAQYAEKHL